MIVCAISIEHPTYRPYDISRDQPTLSFDKNGIAERDCDFLIVMMLHPGHGFSCRCHVPRFLHVVNQAGVLTNCHVSGYIGHLGKDIIDYVPLHIQIEKKNFNAKFDFQCS